MAQNVFKPKRAIFRKFGFGGDEAQGRKLKNQ